MSRFTLITPTSDGSRLYKSFSREEAVVSRNREAPGTYFKVEYRDFSGFNEMCGILDEVMANGNMAIVRGDIETTIEARVLHGMKIRRTKFQRRDDPPGLEPAVRDWVMLDVDKFEVSEEDWNAINPALYPDEAVRFIIDKLPYYFRDASCWWQFSASQSVFPYRNISLHMFFLLDRTVSDTTMRLWAESQGSVPGHLPLDKSVFDCIQPHYIATPRFVGMPDPLTKRSGVHIGERSIVVFDVPEEVDTDSNHSGNIHPLMNMKKLKPFLDMIGDDVGRLGFSEAIKSVVGKYFSEYGASASDIPLKTAIRRAVEDAPKKQDRPMEGVGSPAMYASDNWLDPLIRAIRTKESDDKEAGRNLYQKMLERYVYVEDVERFLDLTTITYRTKTGVTDTHSFELPKLCDILLGDANLRRVSRQTYKPGAPPFCLDEDPKTGKQFRAYNTYTPSLLKPGNPKDAQWFVDHMEYICDGEEAAFVAIVSWLAHLVQQPAEKLNFGILLQGMQGTGKSFISQIMNKVLGVQNCTSSTTTQQMMGQFTDWMEGKQLVTIEEIRDQEERFKVYNHLKGLITNDVVKINIKGIPAYDVPNRTNFICYTNYEDAVPMDDDDRRFIIHFSRALPKPPQYYKDLGRHVENDCGSVLSYLLQVDLTKFDPKGRAPMTASKKEFLQVSGGNLSRWLKEGLESQSFPFDTELVSVGDMRRILPPNLKGTSDTTMAAALKRAGCVAHGRKEMAHGRIAVWSVRNHEKWAAATMKEFADYYLVPGFDNGEPKHSKPKATRKEGMGNDF
jgi:hypothetical protein